MDRFIGVGQDVYYGRTWHLKSNMDRFIDLNSKTSSNVKCIFKIQYG